MNFDGETYDEELDGERMTTQPDIIKRANTDWKEVYDNLLDRLMEIDRMTGTDQSYRYAVEELIDIENKNMNKRWL